jgi:hypothetical protein
MAKKILVKFSDNKTYAIPAEFVANSWAKYYADVDIKKGTKATFAEIFQQEFEYVMKDTDCLLEWLNNNMNWEDVREIAELYKVENIISVYEDEFTNAEKEVIDE